nr:toxin-antitoxin system HicB family antitoxin [Anaerolineae bacterium]
QREAFAALLESLGQASSAEIRQVLDEREEVAPESGLDPEVVACVRQRIADAAALV